MYVEIGGIPQWVETEPGPPGAPALLLVHGGPGASTRFASVMWQAWREHFTLVHWDQRGAGRTYLRSGAEGCQPLSFERIVADGIQVAEYLRAMPDGGPVVVLGHSWGSAVGLHMIAQRPELFAAYVATGMLVSFRANEAENHARLLRLARATGNGEALAALEGLGPAPYDRPEAVRVHREWADRLSEGTGDAPQPRLTATPTNLTPEDRQAAEAAFAFSAEHLFADLCAIDLPALGTHFEIPMFCFMGTHDQQTSFALAEAWFARIAAPEKVFAPLEGCHHFAHVNRPDDFLALLVAHLPRAQGA